ncbi:hypothetical protein CA51_24740 [Rosistilla oblonga]|uniref:Uncharacterized protein n=2 Tax=Rosistilla TaxID=2795779 RepID=A0A518J1S8_9BACT|nr:hypothetical protein EC9_20880 [Rosistilla ulvae]QDV12588.1 hypothetical protein CA51_24740 [Rosistilla oblonga]QDV59290.1 hypothetical protein Mal33_53180 [Rosistilla oblonga]
MVDYEPAAIPNRRLVSPKIVGEIPSRVLIGMPRSRFGLVKHNKLLPSTVTPLSY